MSDELQQIAEKVLEEEGCVNKNISGKLYTIKLLPAMQGVSLCNRLFRTFVPAIGAWFDGGRREGLILPEDDSMFTEIAMILSNKIDELGLEDVIRALCFDLKCNGVVIDFDNHFRGNYSDLVTVLEIALRENFGSFFTEYLKEKGLDLQVVLNTLRVPIKEQSPQKED